MIGLDVYAIPEALTVVDPPSQTIEVRVRGTRSVIRKLVKAELVYKANLSDARPGVNPIVIDPQQLPLPDGVTVVNVSIDDKTIKLEKTIDRTLPVQLRLTGKPAFGYSVKKKQARPAEVRLKGPKSKLAPMTAVESHPIDITGASKPLNNEISLDLPEGVRAAADQPPISASVVIGEKKTEKTLEAITVTGLHTTYAYKIRPETVQLTVRAALRVFSGAFSPKNISVYLDLEGLAPGIYVKPAIINLPPEITLVRAEPQVFTVQIQKPHQKVTGTP